MDLRTPVGLSIRGEEVTRVAQYSMKTGNTKFMGGLSSGYGSVLILRPTAFSAEYATTVLANKTLPWLAGEFKGFFESLFAGLTLLPSSSEVGFKLNATTVRSRQFKRLEAKDFAVKSPSKELNSYLLLRWRQFSRVLLGRNIEPFFQSDRRSVNTAAPQLGLRLGALTQNEVVFKKPLSMPTDASMHTLFNFRISDYAGLLANKAQPAAVRPLGVAYQNYVSSLYRLTYASSI